jgi:hypothetical protein
MRHNKYKQIFSFNLYRRTFYFLHCIKNVRFSKFAEDYNNIYDDDASFSRSKPVSSTIMIGSKYLANLF